MKKVLSALVFILIFLLQTSMGENFKILSVAPNLILVCTILFSANSTTLASGVVGCLAGFFIDAAGYGIIGYNALIMLYISVSVSILSSRFYSENILFSIIIVFIFSFICEFFKVIVSNILFDSMPVGYVTIRYIIPECVYNCVVAVPLSYLIRWLKNEYIRGI